jgi:condensation domain-containing protein/tubulysin polyketide synthase-like protein
MDEIEEVIALAGRRGITLWVDADRLRFRAPAGAMTDQLRAALGSRRAEIIAALQAGSARPMQVPPAPVFVSGPQRETLPIIDYHRKRWAGMKSGEFGIDFVNGAHTSFKLRGPLDLASFQRSLDLVTSRHSILKARVVDTANGPEFVFDPKLEIRLEHIDLSDMPVAQREAAARSIATERIWKRFDDAEPWLRLFVIRLSATEHVVGFVIHHFIADGWSVHILVAELMGAYPALAAGVTPSLPELPFQYFDYVAGMNEWIRSGAAEPSRAYWLEYLRNAPPTRVPPDFDVPPDAAGAIGTETQSASAEVAARLQSFSKSTGISLHAIVAAALIAVTADRSKSGDIVLISRTHGRNTTELYPLVGAFFDSFAVRARVAADMSFEALASGVQGDMNRSSPHRSYPYHLVVEALPAIGASHIAPLLNFMHAEAPPRADAEPFQLLPRPPTDGRNTALHTTVLLNAAGLHCRTEYLSLMYGRETIARVNRSFCRLLEEATHDPLRSLSELLAD